MKRALIVVGLLVTCTSLHAQQDAKTLHETARTYMKQADYANAVLVLKNALQQAPNDLEILKDLAFTYYLQKDYPKALAIAKPFPDRTDADVQSYQILGLIFKATDERKDCEKMYRQALKKFPRSGVLYDEYGEVLGTTDGSDAIKYWEKGIETDPNCSGNYYNACKYYYIKNEKAWSLIYGEMFVNLESYSRRTDEIKDVLAEDYKQLFANTEQQKKLAGKNAFIDAYLQVNYDQSDAIAQGITPGSLTALRAKFITEWFDKQAAKFPMRLFEYHRQLIKEGLFDAYNQWVFGDTRNLPSAHTWVAAHTDEYNRFINFQKGRVFKLPEGQYYQSKL